MRVSSGISVAFVLLMFLSSGCEDGSVLGTDEEGVPLTASMETPIVSLAAGGGHTCAVSHTGEAYCWGDNGSGQHGTGTRTSAPYPVRVSTPAPFSEIAASGGLTYPAYRKHGFGIHDSFTCGLDRDGSAYCWGDWSDGQLGIGPVRSAGARTGARVPPEPPRADTPHRVPGGPFRSLAIGRDHGCALGADGRLHCWGEGVMPGGRREAPEAIPGGPWDFTEIEARGFHRCALEEEGRAFCWGWNRWGVAGVSSAGMDARVLVPRRVAPEHRFEELAVGGGHVCGLTGSGQVHCWGRNDFGQLGTGTRNPVCTGPQRNTFTCPDDPSAPRAVVGEIPFASIVAGQLHTCGLTPEGHVFCWGRRGNRLRQASSASTAEPHPVDTEIRFRELAAGARHTCGISLGGRVYCWGLNHWSQLGTGATADSYVFVPQPVSGQE